MHIYDVWRVNCTSNQYRATYTVKCSIAKTELTLCCFEQETVASKASSHSILMLCGPGDYERIAKQTTVNKISNRYNV